MKKLFILAVAAIMMVGCNKQQTETATRNITICPKGNISFADFTKHFDITDVWVFDSYNNRPLEEIAHGSWFSNLQLPLKKKNEGVRRGSRILHYGGGEPTRYYASKWTVPDSPKIGVYSVEADDNGKLYILYMPEGKAYSWSEGYTERSKRIGWFLGSYINYDAVTSDEIEAYLKDRTQRKYYADIIPLLTNLKKAKAEEEAWERDFSNLMAQQFSKYDADLVRRLISEAIVWWREKVIYIRPLKSDDKKSWRMIKSYIEKHLDTNQK